MTTEKTSYPPIRRKAGERDRLLRSDWQYIEPCNMDDDGPEDWAVMNRQRTVYQAEERARQAL